MVQAGVQGFEGSVCCQQCHCAAHNWHVHVLRSTCCAVLCCAVLCCAVLLIHLDLSAVLCCAVLPMHLGLLDALPCLEVS